jgi:hypothetical protein
MITLKRQISLDVDNTYMGKEIFTEKDIERLEKKYSNLGLNELETIRLFYIRKYEIISLLDVSQNYDEAIFQFNELSEFSSEEQIYENSIDTWEFLKTSNTEEELEEAKSQSSYDSNKRWMRFDYGAYAISMNDEELVQHIKDYLARFEENILG